MGSLDLEAAWEAADLYDPSSPEAAERLAVLTFLHETGCSLDEMVTAQLRGRLFALAGDREIRGGTRRCSIDDIASELDTDATTVRTVWRALGLEEPHTEDVPIATEADLDAMRTALLLVNILGSERALGVLRTYGAAMARATEAASAAFRAINEISVRRSGSELTTAKIWHETAGIVADIGRLLDVVHRHHVDASRRHFEDAGTELDMSSTEELRIAVGFVDLSGFTALSQTLPVTELSELLTLFETTTFELARTRRCRVVKFIGDAAMVVSSDCAALAYVADHLTREFTEPLSVRAGLAFGDVVAREGDYFGTPVNLAARLISTAAPGSVVVSASFAEMLPEAWRRDPMAPQRFRGFSETVPIVRISRFPNVDG